MNRLPKACGNTPGHLPEGGMPSPAWAGVGMVVNMLTRRIARRESMPPSGDDRKICQILLDGMVDFSFGETEDQGLKRGLSVES